MEVYGLTADTGINGELRQLSKSLNTRAEGLTPALVSLFGRATNLAAYYHLIADPKTLEALRQTLSLILGNQSPLNLPAAFNHLISQCGQRAKFRESQLLWVYTLILPFTAVKKQYEVSKRPGKGGKTFDQ